MAAALQMTGDWDTSQTKQWIRYEQPELTGPALRYMATASRRVRGSWEVQLCGRLGKHTPGRGMLGFFFIIAFQGHVAREEYEKQKMQAHPQPMTHSIRVGGMGVKWKIN